MMKTVEVMGTVNAQGQITLDLPLKVDKNTRVKVIVMLLEEENSQEEDELISESAAESFRQGWADVIAGNTIPLSQMWEGIDAE
ncbi:MAG TPA: hypothetical protein VK203_04270 [Nostocaceae cyanobacterium]|nr:hypothetical protein [Nostocaceae cyanobacterium]